ncbi:hypothetical protein C8J56DRAFT_1052243 [Mycena floridula]|nr:hypothetical protein C8J56DRAFT_1052243 [Mycena floridula]
MPLAIPRNRLLAISQAANKFLEMQDVYEEAVGQVTKIRDKAFVNEFNQMLGQSPSRNRLAVVDVSQLTRLHQMPASQESDIWDRMTSPPLGYQTPQLLLLELVRQLLMLMSMVTTALLHSELVRLLHPKLIHAITTGGYYVVYHSEYGSHAGIYKTWAETDAVVGKIPGDKYECWVVSSGVNPGIYTSRKLFIGQGFAYSGGTFRYFSGPATKKRAGEYMENEERLGHVTSLAPSVFPGIE